MKFNEILHKAFGRVKYSLCDQYWNKYDSFDNIKSSVLFIQVNMQETCLLL